MKRFKASKFYKKKVNLLWTTYTDRHRISMYNLDYGDKVRPAVVTMAADTGVFKVFHMDEGTNDFKDS